MVNAVGLTGRTSGLVWLVGLFLLAPVGLWVAVAAGWIALPVALPPPGQIAVLLIAAPIIEEWVFRGHLQPWLSNQLVGRLANRHAESIPAKLNLQLAAIVVTSLTFAVMHWFASGAAASWWVFLPSLALGWLQIKTGDWRLCALLHSSFNAVWCTAIWCIKFISVDPLV